MNALREGSLQVLIVLNNDILGKAQKAGTSLEAFAGLRLIVALATHSDLTTNRAHISLPLGTYQETDGTWVNHAGRVQRFHRAVNPPGEVRAGWELLPVISSLCGVIVEPRSPGSVFGAMSRSVEAFEEMSYDLLGEGGIVMVSARASAA